MLACENIRLEIDGKKILDDINLRIEDNQFVVITGPNGSGKSTLAKVIAGIQPADSGTVSLNGEDLTGKTITERAKAGVAFAFQQPVRFKGLTVRDLLKTAYGKECSDGMLRDLLHGVGLCARDYLDRDLDDSLSGGEAKRIEIAMMLLRDSRFLLFDEPEAGIDLWSFANLIDVFKKLRSRQDRSIVVISHQERILNIADRIVVLNGGRITADDEREAILPDILEGNVCCEQCPQMREEC